MKIYCAHAMTGLTYKEVMDYYRDTVDFLKTFGYKVLCPMTGKERMESENDTKLKAYGYTTKPVLADKAILGRDHWMVHQSDIVYVNLIGATTISIGCCMELAFAKAYNKHTIVVMESTNIHNHCFVLQCANVVFENTEEAEDYLKQLILGI